MSKVRLIILGSASGVPTMRRNTTSVCLQAGARMYLLDAGEGCVLQAVKMGLDVNRVSAVFLSHMHADHTGGLPMLLQTMQLTGRKQPLYLCMPAEGMRGLNSYLNAVYLMRELLPFPVRITSLSRCKPAFDDGHIRLIAYRNRHLMVRYAQLKARYPVKGQSYSFRIEQGDKTIVYSGDIRSLEELLPVLGGRVADFLLLECAHYPLDSAWSAFNGKVRTIVIHHIHPALDRRGAAIKQAIKKQYAGNVIIARDRMIING